MEKAVQIARAGRDGRDLVLSRYWPSGVVYGGADGLDFEWLVDIHQHLPPAHHYVLLDIPPELSAQRRPGRRDRYERQAGLMQEVAERYRRLWSAAHQRAVRTQWHVLDGSAGIEDLEAQIWKIVASQTSPTSATS
jgi:thymidylate kinase